MNNRIKSIILFTIICLVTCSVNAQSNCEIYRKVVDSIYSQMSGGWMDVKTKIDPTSPDSSVYINNKVYGIPKFLYISKTSITKYDIENWGRNLKSKNLNTNVFKEKTTSLEPCSFGNNYCYKFCNSTFQETNFDSLDYCPITHSKLQHDYISLSPIFYSPNGKLALVYVKYQMKYNDLRFIVELAKYGKSWRIIDTGGGFSR